MAAARVRTAKLFVTRLPWTACRVSLQDHFKQFGEVKDTNVIFDMNTGRSKKYGFVIFSDPENIQKAVDSGPHIIDGKEVMALISEPIAGKHDNLNSDNAKTDDL